MRIKYSGITFFNRSDVIRKRKNRTFAGIAPNPTVDLPILIEDVLKEIDAVLLTHTHPDHFDKKL
jgi:L-ascorbate metabolism protein UlaG (beta-lactamase superfamily)